MANTITYTKVLSEDSSFQLIRTNPKLTGNVKLTLNSSGNLWLNSIPVNLELAKDDYSKFPVDLSHSLASNIHRFFKNGDTPNEIIFDSPEGVDSTKTSKNFKDQYDFSKYFSGAKYLVSNRYDERLSYFAPLYLKNKIPNYFVILKIKDPINYPIDVFKTKFESSLTNTEYIIDLFKNSTIIKTFDLSEESQVGKYIRSYLNEPNFPISPLSVSFEENQYTTWNGIVIDSGIFGHKGELLYDEYRKSTPLKFFEENITNGFQRNGIIMPNILNLEFIFDDDFSENYEINRYIGLYVNSIELSKLEVNLNKLYSERHLSANTPLTKRPYYEYEETELLQNNSSGVEFPYKNIEVNISEFGTIFSDANALYFNYITDKDKNLHLPKLETPYLSDYSEAIDCTLSSIGGPTIYVVYPDHNFNQNDLITIDSSDSEYSGTFFVDVTSDSQFSYTVLTTPFNASALGSIIKELNTGKIKISDSKIDLATLFGPSNEIYLQDTGFVTQASAHSYSVIKINSEFNNFDAIEIYHPNGSKTNANGKYDLLTGANNYSLIPNPGDSYVYNDVDNVLGYDVFYFNGSGHTYEVASAIATCLNGIRKRTFTAYAYKEYVFIKCNARGDFDKLHGVLFNPQISNIYSTVDLDYTSGTSLISNIIYFKGGSKLLGNRLVLDRSHLGKINSNIDNLLIRTVSGWSKIKKVSSYIDLVNEENLSTEASKNTVISEYNDKIVITLENTDSPSIRYTEFIIKKKFRPSFGLLSLFPIKDLDFDFYSSQYLNFPNIDFYQYYYIPEETEMLEAGITYSVKNGTILVDGIQYTSGATFTPIILTEYSIVSGNPIVTYDPANLTYPINDENNELKNFQGFSILKDPSKVIASEPSDEFQLKTKFINGISTTEYDYYKENDSTDFALRSKILPYITKWGIKNGNDSRNNPYRLNTELIFGKNNFSPDHTDASQNPINFTHEWFYIESKFNYINDSEVLKLNEYYFDTPLDIPQLLSDPDYFLDYFTYTPKFINQNGDLTDIGKTQFRYSKLFKNEANNFEAFFKGFKLAFKDVNDESVIGEDGKPVAKNKTNRFDGYSFTCIVKSIKEDLADLTRPPVKYRFIEHKTHKFIVLVIEIVLGSIDQIDQYWNGPAPLIPSSITSNPTNIPATSIFITDPTGPFLDLPFETVNGEYRISFDTVNSQDISNLTHTLLYTLKNKKYNTKLNNFSNVKLASKLNIATNIFANHTIKKLANSALPGYPTNLTDEIIDPNLSKTVGYLDTNSGLYYFIDTISGISATGNNPIDKSFDDFIKYSFLGGNSIGISVPLNISPFLSYILPLPLNIGFASLVKDYYSFFVALGGEKYHERLFQKLSFAKFKKYVNEFDGIINYESYELDQNGINVQIASPKYYVEILDPAVLEKINQVIPISDVDKPSQFSHNSEIGYVYEQAKLSNVLELTRYKGNYEPIVKNLLYCKSNYTFTKNLIDPINLANIQLNTNILGLLTVDNFNHIKVSNTKILTLESDESYLPKYPKINEVAIGQSNYFLLSGNWDWGFHHRYTTNKDSELVSGSLRVEEDDTFLNKLMTVPNEISLDQFTLKVLTETEELEDVDISQIELVVKEKANSVDGYINLNNALISYFISNNIEQKFNDFLVNSPEYLGAFESIQEYVIEYIKINILKLYDVSLVEFYKKRNATLSSDNETNTNTINFVFLTDSDRTTLKYLPIKTVNINKSDRLILKFSIKKNFDSGNDISPKIKIKFI